MALNEVTTPAPSGHIALHNEERVAINGLTSATSGAVFKGDLVVNLDDSMVLDGVTNVAAAIQAAHDALPSAGGTLFLPEVGRINSTINITKSVTLRGHGPGWGSNRRSSLKVAAGVTGFYVTGSRVQIEDMDLESLSTTSGTDDGIRLNGTRFRLSNCEVRNFGHHGVVADTTTYGGNANNGVIDQVRSYSNRGNGFHIAGIDSNSIHLRKCDSVSNTGDGFYNDGNTNLLDTCHTSGNGARDFRDKGNGNVYIAPYVESGDFEIESDSAYGVVVMGNYALPTFVMNATAAVSWKIWANGQFKRAIEIGGDLNDATPHGYVLESGVYASSAYRLRDTTDNRTIYTVTGSGSRMEVNIPLQIATGNRVQYGSASGPSDYAGTGSPNSVVAARIGSTYRNNSGGAGVSFYVKESGDNTNTGWVAK